MRGARAPAASLSGARSAGWTRECGGRCADGCKKENNVPREPFFFRSWVEQYTIMNDGQVKVDEMDATWVRFSTPQPEATNPTSATLEPK